MSVSRNPGKPQLARAVEAGRQLSIINNHRSNASIELPDGFRDHCECLELGRDESGLGGGTHDGNSGRDCAHRPGGLSESVPEHGDHSLCVKEGEKNQLPWAIEGEEIGVGVVVV